MNTLRQLRNFWIPGVATIVLACSSDAVAQTSYKVTDLGTLNGDNFSCAMAVNKRGWTEIQDGVEDPVSNSLFANLVAGHAVLNIGELKIDLTLGGANSWMGYGGLNDRGEAVGFAETSVPDPDGEDVCAFGTKRTCSPFLWRNGHMSALPTVGGNNGQAFAINNRGQIAGFAETAVPDSSCPASSPSKTDSPVIWEEGQAQALPTVGSDPDGQAQGINEQGQAVGYSGNCTTAFHAVLWEDANAFLLPGLGPVERSNIAWAINDQGQIVGQSRSPDGKTRLAVLWQNREITKLGTLPGDFGAIATGINNRGQVVGSTNDSGLNWSHAFIWEDGVMTDLNTLFPADSNLFATMANTINERGQITGMATVLSGPHAGEIHAFLATPVDERIDKSIADVATTQPKLPANVGKELLQRFGRGRFDQ
jgi:probable HAF family extracellular repeat protein